MFVWLSMFVCSDLFPHERLIDHETKSLLWKLRTWVKSMRIRFWMSKS